MKENKKFTIQKNRNFSVSQNSPRRNFVITKKIAKHGNQAIIVIPRILEDKLKPGTLVELGINILEDVEDGK
jgi:hypothetical protein